MVANVSSDLVQLSFLSFATLVKFPFDVSGGWLLLGPWTEWYSIIISLHIDVRLLNGNNSGFFFQSMLLVDLFVQHPFIKLLFLDAR